MSRLTTSFVTAIFVLASTVGLRAETTEERLRRGDAVVRSLNGGNSQPTLDGLRAEFPFLADAISGYALGDVWTRPVLDPRTRQLAAVAAFAALGHRPFMKIHAGYALNAGVSEDELKEIVYLTTVHAGFPRAIEAAQTLSELFTERGHKPGSGK